MRGHVKTKTTESRKITRELATNACGIHAVVARHELGDFLARETPRARREGQGEAQKTLDIMGGWHTLRLARRLDKLGA